MGRGIRACHSAYVAVRRQVAGVIFSPYSLWVPEMELCFPTWWKSPLPTESCYWWYFIKNKKKKKKIDVGVALGGGRGKGLLYPRQALNLFCSQRWSFEILIFLPSPPEWLDHSVVYHTWFRFCWDGTQGFVTSKQVLYQLNHIHRTHLRLKLSRWHCTSSHYYLKAVLRSKPRVNPFVFPGLSHSTTRWAPLASVSHKQWYSM